MSILDDDLIIGKSLTLEERSLLMTAEAEIDEFRRSFVKAGLALTTIRDGRLYRETHDTFDKYCTERWGLKHSQVYRLIDSAKVFQILSSEEAISSSSQSGSSSTGEKSSSPQSGSSPTGEIGSSKLEGFSPKGNFLPESERQVRPLTKLKKPELVRQAWESACNATNGKPTADDVVEAVNRIVGDKPKRQPKHRTLEEKELGNCGWKADGANRYFGVNLHDQEVGMEIEKIAAELGRSNAAAISKSVEAYRLLPLQSAEIAELKEKLVEKDQLIAALQQDSAKKDKLIAELTRKLAEVNVDGLVEDDIPFDLPQSAPNKCQVGDKVEILSTRHGEQYMSKVGTVVAITSDIGCVVEVEGAKIYCCFEEIRAISLA